MKHIMRNLLLVLAVVVVWVASEGVYVVKETEQAVVTMFGKAIGRPVTDPGLHFKVPFVHKITTFPKNILEWDGQSEQIPTNDKTFIWVDVFARWRIEDALQFFEKVNNEVSAQQALDGILDAAVRNLVTSYNLIETVRTTDRQLPEDPGIAGADTLIADTSTTLPELPAPDASLKLGRAGMREKIHKQAAAKLKEFGIELVDVRFKRVNYVDDVLVKVYDRMKEERKQIAEKLRSEGRGERAKILGKKELELKRIFSEAYRQAQEVKGGADAEATRIYAAAYNRDPEFYSFVKTLDLYKGTMDSTTWAVFSTDSDFLRYMKEYRAR
jgi:membrane protease subunit HflC